MALFNRDPTPHLAKAASLIQSDLGLSSEIDALRMYAVNAVVYNIVNARANAMSAVKYVAADADGNPIDHPINALFTRQAGFVETIKQIEYFLSLVGNALCVPNVTLGEVFIPSLGMIALNPRYYEPVTTVSGGLRHFNIQTNPFIKTRQLNPDEALYLHSFAPFADFDGTSPMEAALAAGGVQAEIVKTQYAYFANKMLDATFLQPAVDQREDALRSANGMDKVIEGLKAAVRIMRGAARTGSSYVSPGRWEVVSLQADFAKIQMGELYRNAAEQVAFAFNYPYKLLTFEGLSEASSREGRKHWYETWAIPQANWYAGQFSEFFSLWYDDDLNIIADTEALNLDDPTKRLEEAERKVKAGFVDLFEGAKLAGVALPDPSLRGLYMIGDTPVPKTQLPVLYQAKYPPAPVTAIPSNPIADAPLALPDATQSAAPLPDDTGTPLWIGLDLANNADLIDLQRNVKARLNGQECNWTLPTDYHLTLLYAPSVSLVDAFAFHEALKELPVPELALKVGSLASFDNVGEHALHFLIRRNTALLEYQAAIFDLAQEYGLSVSSYSNPAQYKPHVTMGYAPNKLHRIVFEGKLTVTPNGVLCDYGDDHLWESAKADSDPDPAASDDDDPLDKLKALAEKSYTPIPEYLDQQSLREIDVILTKALKGRKFSKPRYLKPQTFDYILHLCEVGVTPQIGLNAAKAFELSLRAAKAITTTKQAFGVALVNLLKRAQAEKITKSVAHARMLTTITRYTQQAITDGIKDGGIDDFDLFDGEDENAVAALEWVKQFTRKGGEQDTYIGNMLDVLYSDNGISDDEIVNTKPDLWFNGSVYPAYLEGLGIAAKNGLFEWVWGDTDHCQSCRVLNGQIRTFRYWRGNILPKSRELCCKGHRCGCGLEPRIGKFKKMRGNLPNWRACP